MKKYHKDKKDMDKDELLAHTTQRNSDDHCPARSPDSYWHCSLPSDHAHLEHIGADGTGSFARWGMTDEAEAEVESMLRSEAAKAKQAERPKLNKYPRAPITATEKATVRRVNDGRAHTDGYCGARHPEAAYVCTREKGHIGQHIATTTASICCAPWEVIEDAAATG